MTLLGGVLRGMETLDISLGGAFTAYPAAKLGSAEASVFNLDSITVLDGGIFKYMGNTDNGDELTLSLAGDFEVQGGGTVEVNKLKLTGQLH